MVGGIEEGSGEAEVELRIERSEDPEQPYLLCAYDRREDPKRLVGWWPWRTAPAARFAAVALQAGAVTYRLADDEPGSSWWAAIDARGGTVLASVWHAGPEEAGADAAWMERAARSALVVDLVGREREPAEQVRARRALGQAGGRRGSRRWR